MAKKFYSACFSALFDGPAILNHSIQKNWNRPFFIRIENIFGEILRLERPGQLPNARAISSVT
jgi:hypothetical protein